MHEQQKAQVRQRIWEIDDLLFELQSRGYGPQTSARHAELWKERLQLLEFLMIPMPTRADRVETPTLTRRHQDRKDIEACLETRQIHEIECCACDARQCVEGQTRRHAAQTLINHGWVYCKVESMGLDGALCPQCACKSEARLTVDCYNL